MRRQGHGTFVGSQRRPITGSWHARFVGPDGLAELPVFATIAERRLVKEEGAWSDALGPDPKGYAMIARRLDVGGMFTCASRLYLRSELLLPLVAHAPRRAWPTST